MGTYDTVRGGGGRVPPYHQSVLEIRIRKSYLLGHFSVREHFGLGMFVTVKLDAF